MISLSKSILVDDWLGRRMPDGCWQVEDPQGSIQTHPPFPVESHLLQVLLRCEKVGKLPELSYLLLSPRWLVYACLAEVISVERDIFARAFTIREGCITHLAEQGLLGQGRRVVIPNVLIGQYDVRIVVDAYHNDLSPALPMSADRRVLF